MHLVVTTCTNRKRAPPAADLRVSQLGCSSATEVAADWVARLHAAQDRTLATRLYAGRGFQEARAAAAAINADVAIISAGLGFIEASKAIPPYSLSVVPGSADNVLARTNDRPSAADWWRLICQVSPFSRSVSDVLGSCSGIIILAVSDAYLSMIADDLNALSADVSARLRIVTRAPEARIPRGLRACVMPYDDRLDGPNSTIRGTRGDFAARAARHFAQEVIARNPGGTVDEHASAVLRLLSAWQYPPATGRTRHEDDAILDLLRAHWDRVGGQSGKLLRVLRDELQVACEQGRFVGLMNRVRNERKLAA